MQIQKYSIQINFIAFQAGWFACVLGAANNLVLLGPLLVVFTVPLQIYFLTKNYKAETLFVIICGTAGFLLETAMIAGNVYIATGRNWGLLCPPWMAALWFNFAPLISISLHWLKGRYLFAALLGGIFGPIAYWGGGKLGALTVTDTFVQGYFPLVILWTISLPGLVYLHKKLTIKLV